MLALIDELLGRFADAYAAAKRARSAVDFDDLELHARDLLAASPAAAGAYAGRFERIMVDEFQDTNPLQLEILGFLDRGNVFTVGDELQSIYGFRHADVEVFRRRRRELDAVGAAATLATSFRARPGDPRDDRRRLRARPRRRVGAAAPGPRGAAGGGAVASSC